MVLRSPSLGSLLVVGLGRATTHVLENMAGSSAPVFDQRKDDHQTGELSVSVECPFLCKTADALTLAFSLVEATPENEVAIVVTLDLDPAEFNGDI